MKFLTILSILFFLSICSFHSQNLKGRSLVQEKIIATITSDDESALIDATKILWESGGYIYIDTPVITITKGTVAIHSQKGNDEGGIIGIKQPNGQYPILNCKPLRKKNTDDWGLLILNDNLKVQNLIIENAPGYGIFVQGKNNIIDHVITRYNGESGIYILILEVITILLIIAILIEIFLCLKVL